jgi:hypothetical protein
MYAGGEMQKNDYKSKETLINNDDDSKWLSRILIEKSPIHTISATDFIADCDGKSCNRRITKTSNKMVGKNTLHAFQDATFKISAAFFILAFGHADAFTPAPASASALDVAGATAPSADADV